MGKAADISFGSAMTRSARGGKLPVFRLDSADGAEESFERWRTSLGSVYDIDLFQPEDIKRFDVQVHAFNFGPLLAGTLSSIAQSFARDKNTIVRGGLDLYIARLYTRGGCEIRLEDGRSVHVNTGDMWLQDLTRPCTAVTTDFTNISVSIPRGMIEPLLKNSGNAHGVILPRNSALGQMLGQHFLALCANASGLTVQEGHQVADSTARFIAACFDSYAESGGTGGSHLPSPSALAVRRYIEDHLGNAALGPATLLDRFAMSRASLYRMFESFGGVAEYIRRRRLAVSFREIASSPDRRVSDVAFRSGFSSEAAFSRAFRREYGLTPTQARFELPASQTPESDAAFGREGTLLDKWNRDLVFR